MTSIGNSLEKIRLQTLYCTDPNKLKLVTTAGSTSEEHTLQSQGDRPNRTQENFYHLTGEVYNNRQVLHKCNLRDSVAIQNAKTYLAKMIIHYTKYTF